MAIPQTFDAAGSTTGSKSTEIDPELAKLIEAWPSLPTATKAAIVEIIDQAGK